MLRPPASNNQRHRLLQQLDLLPLLPRSREIVIMRVNGVDLLTYYFRTAIVCLHSRIRLQVQLFGVDSHRMTDCVGAISHLHELGESTLAEFDRQVAAVPS